MPDDEPEGLTHAERQDVEELSAPRSPVIYEVVRQQGEDELCRPDSSLFWSGIAAGMTIMASVIAQGALRQKLPDAPWREVVSGIGYSVGDFWVVLTLTYVIALGEFTHVIAGSAEAFLLLFAGRIEIAPALGGLIAPALIGNVIGGTGLFALLAHAQVRQEL